jgi:16S rRNA (cytosine1402-N4)-methyltransferase
MALRHVPVLLHEVVEYACCRDGDIFVDATLGSGGHSRALLERYPGIARLIGIDRDGEAIGRAQRVLDGFGGTMRYVQGNFRDLRALLAGQGIGAVQGILFDFGISTPQLDDPGRGFGFARDGALDMRMDQSMPGTALDLIKKTDPDGLAAIIATYGEERFARRIARALKQAAEGDPALTTAGAAAAVSRAVPARLHSDSIHPATRTFQALRIAVNDELAAIEQGLDQALELLTPGGRLLAISFHSLEDRIVKQRFRAWEKGCTCPPDLPRCACGGTSRLRAVTRKAVRPTDDEVRGNPRSRSARLRVGERLN